MRPKRRRGFGRREFNQPRNCFATLFDARAKHEAASSSERDVHFVIGEMSRRDAGIV